MNVLRRISERPGPEAVVAEPADPASASDGIAEGGSGQEPEPEPAEEPTGPEALLEELTELRTRVQQLEADLAGYRSQEELISKTLLAAVAHAARIREEARRDAQIALRKARAKADDVLGGIAQERSRAERELLRLRNVTEETRAVLSGFLNTALEQLRVDEDPAAGRSASASGVDDALRDALEDTLRKEEMPASPPSPTVESVET